MQSLAQRYPETFTRRRIRRAALGRDTYRDLAAGGPGLSFWLGPAACYAVLIGLFAGLAFMTPIGQASNAAQPIALLVAAFLAVGALQFVLLHASHEAWHHFLGRPGPVGRLAAFLLAYPLGLSSRLRAEHLTHHVAFGADEDPDRAVYAFRPTSKLHALGELAVTLSGWRAVEQFTKRYEPASREAGATRDEIGTYRELLSIVAVQATILAILTATVGFWAYPLLWLLPLLSVVKTLAFLRGVAEHGDPSGASVLRTFRTREPFSRWILGSYGFWCHAEHHLFDRIPSRRLHAVVDKLDGGAADSDRGIEIERVDGGHLAVLAAWWKLLPWVASARRSAVDG
jgi:fatty acid desaturase